jgi:hypothetical protein
VLINLLKKSELEQDFKITHQPTVREMPKARTSGDQQIRNAKYVEERLTLFFFFFEKMV